MAAPRRVQTLVLQPLQPRVDRLAALYARLWSSGYSVQEERFLSGAAGTFTLTLDLALDLRQTDRQTDRYMVEKKHAPLTYDATLTLGLAQSLTLIPSPRSASS